MKNQFTEKKKTTISPRTMNIEHLQKTLRVYKVPQVL